MCLSFSLLSLLFLICAAAAAFCGYSHCTKVQFAVASTLSLDVTSQAFKTSVFINTLKSGLMYIYCLSAKQVNDVNFENMSNDDAVRILREIVSKPG